MEREDATNATGRKETWEIEQDSGLAGTCLSYVRSYVQSLTMLVKGSRLQLSVQIAQIRLERTMDIS